MLSMTSCPECKYMAGIDGMGEFRPDSHAIRRWREVRSGAILPAFHSSCLGCQSVIVFWVGLDLSKLIVNIHPQVSPDYRDGILSVWLRWSVGCATRYSLSRIDEIRRFSLNQSKKSSFRGF